MFIVSVLDIINQDVKILKVVDDDDEHDRLKAFDNLIKDALSGVHHSIKHVNNERVEVFEKGYLGSYLSYVYTLHEVNDNDNVDIG